MRHILGAAGKRLLAEFARSSTLVALDFDGTLAPIVADRDVATMRAITRARLAAVAERYPTAVISGRSRSDVLGRLTGVPIDEVIGNHGIEPTQDMEEYEPAIRAMREHLAFHLDMPGVDVEDKRYSLAVHYRLASSKSAAREAILRVVASLPSDVRPSHGKLVINILPAAAPHKGDALRVCWTRQNTARAIFVGDDRTDEDVFQFERPDRLLSIRVGRDPSSAAPWFLREQLEIDALFAELVAFRASVTAPPDTEASRAQDGGA